MAFPQIKEAVEYAIARYGTTKKKLFFSIQSNAYSLTREMIRFFAEHHFGVRVSLDGTKQTHDAQRVTHAKTGSYDRVVAGIRGLQESGINPGAVCVVHNRNVHQLIEMYDSMTSLGVSGIRFLPVFKSGNAKDQDWMDGDTYFDAYFGLLKHMAKLGRTGRPICKLPNLIAGELGSLTSFQRNYMCMRGPCGAGTNMIAIDTNGDLYPCEEMIGKPIFRIGNVTYDSIQSCLDTHPVMKQLKERHVDHIPECERCVWKQMCHGGCVHKSYTHFKRFDRESEHCSYYKKIYRELIWLEALEPGTWEILGAKTSLGIT